jgi:hypothetical protein
MPMLFQARSISSQQFGPFKAIVLGGVRLCRSQSRRLALNGHQSRQLWDHLFDGALVVCATIGHGAFGLRQTAVAGMGVQDNLY